MRWLTWCPWRFNASTSRSKSSRKLGSCSTVRFRPPPGWRMRPFAAPTAGWPNSRMPRRIVPRKLRWPLQPLPGHHARPPTPQRQVPAAAPARPQRGQSLGNELESLLQLSPIKYSWDCHGGRPSILHSIRLLDSVEAHRPAPVLTDRGEQAVFDLVPLAGPWWEVAHVDFKPVSSANFCNSSFHKRSRYPLLPPASAVISSGRAPAPCRATNAGCSRRQKQPYRGPSPH